MTRVEPVPAQSPKAADLPPSLSPNCCTMHTLFALCRFPQGGVPWFNKRVEQVFPETEAEGTLFWNGSTKAEPGKKGKTSLFYIVNEDKTNR